MLYALIPAASGSSVLRAIDLRTGRVRRGTSYRVSGLALAAGYLWVYGSPGPDGPFVLDEVSPRTLATIRALSVPGNPDETAAPAAGAAGSVWAGADRTLLRISVRTGAVLTRAVLPSGLELTGLAAAPAATTVYASAVRLRAGGAVVLEYDASTGRRLAQSGAGDLKWSLDGASLTALPGGVWVWPSRSHRHGTAGAETRGLCSDRERRTGPRPGRTTGADAPRRPAAGRHPRRGHPRFGPEDRPGPAGRRGAAAARRD
ncbi:MAG: hypothetical protein ACRDOA_03515 [Streptosporangiaceae bacterium]